ncbi:hypothetical protein CLAFUW4_08369 [Fulvia fulva]|uniref:Uncharacterized protein n=1 Tax=Passalora fulva TaxID=5499 RepID=A0A9Q8LCT7_PASFU|nr:uncharacterized protein CLAFUR5_08474 [Fulvia fulva]KAK4629255.1 hypothetical protein CLAFUR4_08374 [Fulvia fulva]KAK4629809.1 hypothetical protein CLAFUR0_08369 [Fulvia fulva]UJO15041.1 hypothetical protein CLAFUR5_08474 [Fulvia fulva]WPV12122.1 hypothetical protein CLAFUW4_08369 [Fulvia fulva]WPV27835.1 hypothetical protein CLAFUW7_08369 [Fulvia fulva]
MPPKRRSTRLSSYRTNAAPLVKTVTGQPAFKVQKTKAAPACANKVRTLSKTQRLEGLEQPSNASAQRSEQEQEQENASTAVTVALDKALVEKLSEGHMLLLRGQQDLKADMASLKAEFASVDERLARVEATAAPTVQELSGVSAHFADAVGTAVCTGTQDLRATLEETKASVDQTRASVRMIQHTAVTSGEVDTLQDNLNSRIDSRYARTESRLDDLDTNVIRR